MGSAILTAELMFIFVFVAIVLVALFIFMRLGRFVLDVIIIGIALVLELALISYGLHLMRQSDDKYYRAIATQITEFADFYLNLIASLFNGMRGTVTR